MTNRSLVGGIAGGAVCALALILLPSWPALLCAGVLGVVLGGFFAWWIRRDAPGQGQDAALWPWAMLLWPLALPPYLVITRGMRGLLLAAATLFLFFLLPFTFLGSIVRQDYVAGRLIDEGQSLSWKTDTGEDPEGKKRALELFKRAIAVNPNAWQAYMMVFVTSFELDRREVSDEYYRRLLALRQGAWRRTASDGSLIGWYLTALHYHDYGQVMRLDAAMSALNAGDTRRLAAEARAALRHRREVLALTKEWQKLYESLGRGQLARYAEDLAKMAEFTAYLRKEGWKAERAGALAERIDADEKWRLAIESYGQGLIAGAAGRRNDALGRFAEAARRQPEFAEAELMRASLLLDGKRYAAARTAASGAIRRLEQHPPVLFQLTRDDQLSVACALEGFALHGVGMTAAARRQLARALAFDPDGEAAKRLGRMLEAGHGR
ncbi:MAG: hypothetical protein ABIJ96_16025 [Elusimicrobiota bacterium]